MVARAWSALLGAAMLVLLFFYVATANRNAAVSAAGRIAQLSLSGREPATADFTLSTRDARRALVADPLNQRLVDAAMVAQARVRPGIPSAGWWTALSSLGWRDTTSRQNLLIRHAQQGDLSAIVDDVDGLLRRNQLIDQSTPILLAVEADPRLHGRVVARLRGHPAWRFGYLQRGSLIADPVQLAARARTLQLLQRSGDDVAADEIAPVLPKLLDAGLGEQAFAIWRWREPEIARPVADPHFATLASQAAVSTVPFHWQLTNGPDYAIDALSRPVPHLAVSWNGAGAPVFASQYLSAPAGRYAVLLATSGAGDDAGTMIGVRAVCGADVVDFGQPRRASPARLVFSPPRAIPCAFARLELFGRPPTAGLRDRQAEIAGVAIAPA